MSSQTKKLLLAAVIFFLASCDAGVGGDGDCGPHNCTGCCSAQGQCLQGTAANACGRGGVACFACPGGSCNASTGMCDATGSCGPSSCPAGCCTATGQCITPGNLPQACGSGGQACATCLPTQQCSNSLCVEYNPNACNNTNCPGCCLGDSCINPPQNGACGLNGAPCTTCNPIEICSSTTGQCISSSGCGAVCVQQNGCCFNNQCMPGNHPAACGANGDPCQTCAPDQLCIGGRCGGSLPDPCTPTNCASGCCDENGRCHYDGGSNALYCGLNGVTCNECASWDECSWGRCQPYGQTCLETCIGGCCYGGDCIPFYRQTNALCGKTGTECSACQGTCSTADGTCLGVCFDCKSDLYRCCNGIQCVQGTANQSCGSNGTSCQDCTKVGKTCKNVGGVYQCA